MKPLYLIPLIALAGCSATAAPSTPAPAPSTPPPSTAPATAPSSPPADCVDVSDALAQHLALAIDEGATASAAGGVKSGSSESYVVAVRLAGPEAVNDATAVFEVLKTDEPGLTQAVDGMAREFTQLPESAFGAADPESVAALACLS